MNQLYREDIMNKIQEAIDTLLANNEITQEEYNMAKEAGLSPGFQQDLLSILKTMASASAKPKPTGFTAGLKGLLEAVQPYAWGAAAAGGAGIAAKELIVDPIASKLKTDNSFEQMQIKVPQLAEKDQEKLKDYFGVIKTFSPKAASNPLVAGHLVNKMMEFGGVDHKLIQDLSSIESGLSRPSLTQSIAETAAKSMVGFTGNGA